MSEPRLIGDYVAGALEARGVESGDALDEARVIRIIDYIVKLQQERSALRAVKKEQEPPPEEFRMRPSDACWDGEISQQDWIDLNTGGSES